ncbi:hypothetical protein C7M84_011673, partial [Penaeus vannamei]
ARSFSLYHAPLPLSFRLSRVHSLFRALLLVSLSSFPSSFLPVATLFSSPRIRTCPALLVPASFHSVPLSFPFLFQLSFFALTSSLSTNSAHPCLSPSPLPFPLLPRTLLPVSSPLSFPLPFLLPLFLSSLSFSATLPSPLLLFGQLRPSPSVPLPHLPFHPLSLFLSLPLSFPLPHPLSLPSVLPLSFPSFPSRGGSPTFLPLSLFHSPLPSPSLACPSVSPSPLSFRTSPSRASTRTAFVAESPVRALTFVGGCHAGMATAVKGKSCLEVLSVSAIMARTPLFLMQEAFRKEVLVRIPLRPTPTSSLPILTPPPLPLCPSPPSLLVPNPQFGPDPPSPPTSLLHSPPPFPTPLLFWFSGSHPLPLYLSPPPFSAPLLSSLYLPVPLLSLPSPLPLSFLSPFHSPLLPFPLLLSFFPHPLLPLPSCSSGWPRSQGKTIAGCS